MRTRSGYFSPNSTIAPRSLATFWSVTSVEIAAPSAMRALISSSTRTTFLRRHRPLVGEVEPQQVVFDFRAALLRVRAETLPQGVMQQVRGRVGTADPGAAVDRPPAACTSSPSVSLPLLAACRYAAIKLAVALRVDAPRTSPLGRSIVPGVADLSAGFAVERRPVQDDRDRIDMPDVVDRLDQLLLGDDADDLRLGGRGVVAEELACRRRLADRVERTFGHHGVGERAAAAGLAVLVQQLLELLAVDRQLVPGGHRFGQLDQEAVLLCSSKAPRR